MAEYKKKKVKQKIKPVKRKQTDSYIIEMKPTGKRAKQVNKASKAKRAKRGAPTGFQNIRSFVLAAAIAVVLLGSYLITYLVHPVGVLEYLNNAISSVGSGSYPVTLSGGETLQTYQKSGAYLVLSNTNVDVFNNSGKSVLSAQHGFLQPVLKTSDVRFLVYDQGGESLKIYNNSEERVSKKYENEIIAAAVAKNGTYAVSTKAEGYESQIIVTDKNEKMLYQWYCAEETVNALALSDNGKTLIASALKVEEGNIKTKVYILKYDSAGPVYSFDYDGVVLSIECSGNNRAVLAFSDRLEFINMKSGANTVTSSNYNVDIFKRVDNYILTCNSLAGNKNETEVTLYKFGGELVNSFKFEGGVDDISYYRGKYYILTESKIFKLDKSGSIASTAECSFDTENIIAISSDSTVGISNSTINKYSLNSRG